MARERGRKKGGWKGRKKGINEVQAFTGDIKFKQEDPHDNKLAFWIVQITSKGVKHLDSEMILKHQYFCLIPTTHH